MSPAHTDERPTKKSRFESQKVNFHPELLKEQTVAKIHNAFKVSQPYLYCKIDQLMNDDLLRKVRAEILSNLHFTVKETDIYKVFQTGDLANLDGLPKDELAQLEHLFKLRNAIYSQEFRDFVSSVTDSGPLSGSKMDMSINSYNDSCHLLNHDDVIGTRRVSYILYLTDPEDPWDPKDGGALELYPVIQKGIPATEPTVIIPPQWNQLVMFTVQPGHSFHSVEEVVAENKPRLSISGWFHVPQQGEPGYSTDATDEDLAKSSLEQLQEEVDSSDKFTQYDAPLDDDATEGLEEADLLALAGWMHPQYLDMSMMEKMAERFLDESVIQCKEILNPEWTAKLQQAINQADKADGFGQGKMMPHGIGRRGRWTCQGPPHRQRYMVLDDKKTENDDNEDNDTSSALFSELEANFASEAFRHWLAVVTQLLPLGYRGQARRFRPGHDYTLATTNTRGQGVLDVTLCMAATGDRMKQALEDWESGEFGGYECYMAPHEEEEDAAVYKAADEEGALLTTPAGHNELSIVLRDEGVMRFIKYVSARAPGSRWDVAFEYDLPEDQHQDDDDDNEDDGEENEQDQDE
ncbi:Oxoglutarate and iron-dependent oxygenase degradation C-term-domain-containing protein [Gongronella butleri]|nr:Oxoglutarate and iron-dependent oxygenase degradation C-term-domain-containing protein [Gongronella butleri]